MSRRILVPTTNSDVPGKQRYMLVPVEGLNEETKIISLPSNLNPHEWMFVKAKNSINLKKLLYKLSKTDLQRTKDGFVCDRNETVHVNYDHGIVSSCNGHFSNRFEKMYCLLRKYGITF